MKAWCRNLLQHEVTGPAIAREVRHWLEQPTRRTALSHRFESIHLQLRCDAASSAARAIQELLSSHGLTRCRLKPWRAGGRCR